MWWWEGLSSMEASQVAKRINAAVTKERILKTENLEVRKRGGQLLREDEVILYVVRVAQEGPRDVWATIQKLCIMLRV